MNPYRAKLLALSDPETRITVRATFADGSVLLERIHLGGPGSGNFDHAGRPGQVGGSGSGGGESASSGNGGKADSSGDYSDALVAEATGSRMRAPTDDDAPRLKALRVPPAWTNVQLAEDHTADLQATGTDAKGRTQYLYSAEHSQRAAAEKFARRVEFIEALPTLRQAVVGDLTAKDRATREAASVLYLIDKTGFRVGSTADTKGDVQAYGASTLRGEHVTVNGDEVTFKFTGKKGVQIEKTVEDKRLAKLMTARKKKHGDGPLFNTTDSRIRGYMGRVVDGFSPKDFRTHQGTALALKEIKSRPVPKSEKELKKAMKAVAVVVAEHLGNTAAVSLKSYIDPVVWGKWRKGKGASDG